MYRVFSPNFDKILNHAESTLIRTPGKTTQEHLNLFKNFLKLENHRLFLAHRAGQSGLTSVKERTYLIDVLIQHIQKISHDEAEKEHSEFKVEALVILALGGYGRQELCMHSDIDVMFLYQEQITPYIDFMIKRILYMLWDVGLKVGHSARSLQDAYLKGRSDFVSRTAMMEARLITGSISLFEKFSKYFQEKIIPYRKEIYLKEKMNETHERWSKWENTVFLVEPNIKEGKGGLRDWHMAVWIQYILNGFKKTEEFVAHDIITESDKTIVEKALGFLFRTRNELYFSNMQLIPDVLGLEAQDIIAKNFGYQNDNILKRSEKFMMDYYHHSSNLHMVSLKMIKDLSSSTPFFSLSRAIHHLPGLRKKNKYLYVASKENPFRDHPELIFKSMVAALDDNLSISDQILNLMRESVAVINTHFKKDHTNLENFLKILTHPKRIIPILRALQQSQVLGKYLPAFGKAFCFTQHDMYHKYTLDEHTIRAMEFIDELKTTQNSNLLHLKEVFYQIEHPDVLFLSVLYHDLGKVAGKNHSHHGVLLARDNLSRIGYPLPLLERIFLAVEKHLLLSFTSQRRNLSEKSTIESVVKQIIDLENLKILYCLTYADMSAVAPGIWNDWRSTLLKELYLRAEAMLLGTPQPEDQQEVIIRKAKDIAAAKNVSSAQALSHLEQLPFNYMQTFTNSEIAMHIYHIQNLDTTGGTIFHWSSLKEMKAMQLTVITKDVLGLFSKITGVLASQKLNILNAFLFSRSDGIAIDQIIVQPIYELNGFVNEHERMYTQNHMLDVFHDKIILETLFHKSDFIPIPANTPIKITFDNEASITHTIAEVQTIDQIGLLYKLARTFSQLGIDIHLAKLSTHKNLVVDTFYVTDYEKQKIDTEEAQQILRDELTQAILSPIIPG